MVKILQRGNVRKTICSNCNSLLEYEIDDVLYQDDVLRGMKLRWFYIECPVCDQKVEVDIRNWQ